MRYKCLLKLNKQKSLYLLCLAAVLVYSQHVCVMAGSPISKNIAPDGSPQQLDQRKLYFFKHAFIYSGNKSDAAHVNKRIEAAIKDLLKDTPQKDDTIIGLALVTDLQEKPLVDLQKIIEALRCADKQRPSDKTKKDLKSVIESKENIKKEGMDMDMVLSITPIPVEPHLLPSIINMFPENVGEQIDFCIFVPTGRNIKDGFKKMIDKAIKEKKIGFAKRMALVPLMPLIERKVIEGMKKSQQLVVYERLMEKQNHLSEKQREDKVKAYKQKLGLDEKDNSDSKSDKDKTTASRNTPQ